MTRRVFEHLVLLLWPLYHGTALLAGALRYLSPLEPPRRKLRLEVGPAAVFDSGKVERVEFNGRSIYVLRDAGELLALDATCTHLTCNVNWIEREGCFVCPCHAGRFDRGGKAIRKPPIRPLRRQKLVLLEGKVVLLDDPAARDAGA